MTGYDDLIEEYEWRNPKPDLETTLQALQQHSGRAEPAIVYGLSGLTQSEVQRLRSVWAAMSVADRRRLVRELVENSESNIDLDFRTFAFEALGDVDPGVREAAIELLWEDESLELLSRLNQIAAHDEAVEVRAAAMTAIGRYILLGELGGLAPQAMNSAQDVVLKAWQDKKEPVDVRRRALEAIANCTHDLVPGAIREAYASADQRLRVSAVFAMGRTCDATRWEDIVLDELDSADDEMRYEAVRAAGELELIAAVPRLGQLVLDGDREIETTAVWSLGEIGGKEALRILEALAEKAEDDEDDDLLQAVEDAIGNAVLVGEDFSDSWDD